MTPQEQAETVYLTVFGQVSENSDYLQPEHGPDYLLPEAIMAAFSATVVTSLLTGFFEDFGRAAAERLRRRPFRGSSLVDAEPDEIIVIVRKRLQQGRLDPDRDEQAVAEVEATLVKLGLAPEVAHRLALNILSQVRKALM